MRTYKSILNNNNTMNAPRNLQWDPYEWSDDVQVHATLMLLSWGFFIPVSVLVYSHTYRRTARVKEFGVHFHMICGAIGLALAMAGFGYGINKFSTLGQDARRNVPTYNYAHGVIGCIATGGAALQLLLMSLMRKPEDPLESWDNWPLWRKFGHLSHRVLGFAWLAAALVALETGTHITSVHSIEDLADQNEKYSGALISVFLAAGITAAGVVQVVHCMMPDEESVRPEQSHEKESVEETENI